MNTGDGAPWRRSSWCNTDSCVEVAVGPHAVLVRCRSAADDEQLKFGHDAWSEFIDGLRDGTLHP